MKKLRVKGGDLKVVNPPDEYRKSQRTKEKKKNKAERRFNREQSILRRNPRVIKEELDQLREVQRNGSLTDSQRRRMAKLEQLWDIAIKAVEAEKRARKAELQLDAALSAMTGATEQADEEGEEKSSAALTSRDQRNILNTGGLGDRRKCLPADVCYDDEYLLKKEEEQRRFYNPYLCNAGIFRHPDGSLRGYPPSVRPDVFGQRREFVESLKAKDLRSRANEEDEEEDDESDSSDSDKSSKDEGNEDESKGDDILESIPLPSEPPPDDVFPVPAPASTDVLQKAAEAAAPFLLSSFPVPPTSSSGQGGGDVVPPGQGGAFPFFPPHLAFPPPVPFIPPPPGIVPFQQQQHQQLKTGETISAPPHQIAKKPLTPAGNPVTQFLTSLSPSGPGLPHSAPSGLSPVPMPTSSWQSPASTGAMRQGGVGMTQRPAPYSEPPKAGKPAIPKTSVAFVPTQLRSKTRVAASTLPPGAALQPTTGFMTGLNAQGRQHLDRVKNSTFGSSVSRPGSYASLLSKGAGKVDGGGVGGGINEAKGEQGGKAVDLDELFDDFLKEVGEV